MNKISIKVRRRWWRLAPAQRNNFVKKMLNFIADLRLAGEGGRVEAVSTPFIGRLKKLL